MASREPMWFCHECGAEMRPLMMPDPHCASCRGTFVEKVEDSNDDPRQFHQRGPEGPGGNEEAYDPLDFLMNLSAMMSDGTTSPSQRARDRPRSPMFTTNSSNFSIRIDRTGDGPTRTVFTSSSRSPPARSDSVPPIFGMGGGMGGGARDRREGGDITGPLMFQYLAAMLASAGGRPGGSPFGDMFGPGAEPGRMGDYVFSQEALDQIITQLMENSSSRPVPATEEIMSKLPKTVLEEGSPLLDKDCAVCKDQFQLGTEDPSEQIVVTLPCKHPFHEGCIMPWLKSSATCPVCRHELVPQPHHHNPGEGPSQRPGSPGSGNDRPGAARSPFPGFGPFGGDGSNSGGGQRTDNTNTGGGIFGNLIHTLLNGGGSGGGAPNNSTSRNNTAGTDNTSSRPTGASRNSSPETSRATGGSAPWRSRSPDDNRPGSSGGRSSRSNRRGSGSSWGSGHVPGSWSDVD